MTHEEKAAAMERREIVDLLVRVEDLERQLAWFRQQLHGQKSEKRAHTDETRQLFLGELDGLTREPSATDASTTVAAHTRRRRRDAEEVDEPELRFDPSIPVQEIRVELPGEVTGELVSEKITHRVAVVPAHFVVLRYVRPVFKQPDGSLVCAPAPPSVLGRGLADVSLLASLVVDKLRYHLPLYRQHQRMQAAGLNLARSTLTDWVHRVAELVEPVYQAQLASILKSDVLAMDETPIKAGRRDRGKMQQGYFWPVYGDRREVAFPFSKTRASSVVREVLGEYCGTLVSDGYRAYELFKEQSGRIEHAQCWAHARRHFVKAEDAEPELVERALALIRELFDIEKRIASKHPNPEKKLEMRALFAKPVVETFFQELKTTLEGRALLPSSPYTKAAHYALDREKGLRVFLDHPGVPLDTNHLEREIRPIALGRKNWLFCWTELGAKYVGILQSLIATCRLHDVDPYVYLVDVLQRVDTHPARDVDQLTPRLWKQHFADAPLRSDLRP